MQKSGRNTRMTTMSFTSRVAANVRAEMARGQVTQQSLAGRVKRSQQAISRRLTGRQPFNTEELQDIAEALGVGIEQLVSTAAAVLTAATGIHGAPAAVLTSPLTTE